MEVDVKTNELTEVGKFMGSDYLIVVDPGLSPEHGLVSLAWHGEWRGYVKRDKRNTMLLVHHDCYPTFSDFERLGLVGVDSGQVGIYGLEYYKGTHEDKFWYKMNCYMTLNHPIHAGVLSHGVVSESGYGDGVYEVYKATMDDIICALLVIFEK